MAALLSITFPIFAVIAIGWAALRWQIFPQDGLRPIGQFVMQFALPALMFHTIATRGFSAIFDAGYLVVYALASVLVLMASFGFLRLTGQTRARSAIGALGSSLSNSGYVGYPILLLAYPTVAAQTFALNLMVETFLILPLCMTLIDADRPGASLWRNLGRALVDTLRRPFILGLLAGVAVSVLGLPVPQAVTRLTQLLASATAPLALFFIGGSLAGIALTGNRVVAAQIVVAKLVVHPLIAVALLALVPVLGLPMVSEQLRAPMILSAAMPMFGIYAIIAAEKGHQGMASIALFAATVVSFFTLNALLFWIG